MFRRSGSVACFFVEGSMPDPNSAAFRAALGGHRFRSIEDAASEETAAGWVTRGDPTGGSFDAADLECGDTAWLRMRVDKKSAPTKWLQIHRVAAERAAGRPLSAGERRELKEDLLRRLLPRVLPTVSLVDAVLVPRDQVVLLFATARAVQEHFVSLFHKTFGVTLAAADPCRLALALDLGRERRDYLSQVAPVPWPRLASGRENGALRAAEVRA